MDRIGANILKRTIEYMSSQPFDADREAAMDILNTAIEQCFADEEWPTCPKCGSNLCDDEAPDDGTDPSGHLCAACLTETSN